ncbi:MAG: light-harvesting protein [Sphingomonadales bacterium]|jgi:light-harvesting protein B-800-850 alpha chain
MNEGRIWLYLSPNIGLPVFFVAMAAVALLVHASVLMNTTWFAAFWQGGAATVAAAPATEAAPAAAPAAEAAAPAADAPAAPATEAK